MHYVFIAETPATARPTTLAGKIINLLIKPLPYLITNPMKKFLSIPFVAIALTGIFASCSELNRRVNEKADQLMNKAESLDSLVDKKVDRVMDLDTLTQMGEGKVKKIDSLINESKSKLDSIVSKNISPI